MKRMIAAFTALLLLITLCSCEKSSAAMKFKGKTISEAEYSYWFSTLKAQIIGKYANGAANDEFWDKETPEGQKYGDFFTDMINGQIKTILIASELFDENGLELPDGTEAAIEADVEEKIEFAGGKDKLEADLAEFGMTVSDLKNVYITQAKISAYHEFFAGKASGDVEKYYRDNYRAVKMIQIYTGISFVTDADGNYVYDGAGAVKTITLDSFQRKQKLELVETVAEALRNGADVDRCVAEYSETDYSAYPNGFLVKESDADQYGEDFINALFSMEVGEVRIVEDTLMSFVIYRCELPELSSLGQTELEMLSGMTEDMVDGEIDEIFSELSESVEIMTDITQKYDIRTVRKNSYY